MYQRNDSWIESSRLTRLPASSRKWVLAGVLTLENEFFLVLPYDFVPPGTSEEYHPSLRVILDRDEGDLI